MSNQENFDTQIATANEKLNTIGDSIAAVPAAIQAEGEQVRQFILENPSVDTSALDGVVARLNATAEAAAGLATQIGTVFEPPAPDPEPEPEPEPTPEPEA